MAQKSLTASENKRLIKEKIILLEVEKLPEEINSNNLYFFSQDFFGVIITDADANILQVFNGSSSFSGEYSKIINKALDDLEESKKSLKTLLSSYLTKKASVKELISLIDKINDLNIETSSVLTDDLVRQVPEDSATSLTFLIYIIRNAPSFFSDSYKYFYKNVDNGNMAWYRMELKERIRLNNRMIYKSLTEAIQQKDYNKAITTARYAQNTHQNNFEEGSNAYNKNLVRYFKEVNDTTKYIMYALMYYDRIMNATKTDEIKKADSIELQKRLHEATSNRNSLSHKFVYAPKAQNAAKTLNDGAWDVYNFTKNQAYLKRALNWSKKSNELFQTAESVDTYARLLYATGLKKEAIEMEELAISLRKKMNYDTKDFEKVLEKMRNNELSID